jgi:hypothetical protein
VTDLRARKRDSDEQSIYEKKYVKYDEGAKRYSMGKTAFIKMAKDAKAIVRPNGSVYVHTKIFEKYFDSFLET